MVLDLEYLLLSKFLFLGHIWPLTEGIRVLETDADQKKAQLHNTDEDTNPNSVDISEATDFDFIRDRLTRTFNALHSTAGSCFSIVAVRSSSANLFSELQAWTMIGWCKDHETSQ